ncbi:hypothetical protein GCM10010524_45030 [Streptomyces mexicanus]
MPIFTLPSCLFRYLQSVRRRPAALGRAGALPGPAGPGGHPSCYPRWPVTRATQARKASGSVSAPWPWSQ